MKLIKSSLYSTFQILKIPIIEYFIACASFVGQSLNYIEMIGFSTFKFQNWNKKFLWKTYHVILHCNLYVLPK